MGDSKLTCGPSSFFEGDRVHIGAIAIMLKEKGINIELFVTELAVQQPNIKLVRWTDVDGALNLRGVYGSVMEHAQQGYD